MLNQTVLTGNVGQDPEIFFTSESDPIAKFSLAFKSSKKKTGWIKVVCFKRLAGITEKHLHQGALQPRVLSSQSKIEKYFSSAKFEATIQ